MFCVETLTNFYEMGKNDHFYEMGIFWFYIYGKLILWESTILTSIQTLFVWNVLQLWIYSLFQNNLNYEDKLEKWKYSKLNIKNENAENDDLHWKKSANLWNIWNIILNKKN